MNENRKITSIEKILDEVPGLQTASLHDRWKLIVSIGIWKFAKRSCAMRSVAW